MANPESRDPRQALFEFYKNLGVDEESIKTIAATKPKTEEQKIATKTITQSVEKALKNPDKTVKVVFERVRNANRARL